MDKPPFLEILHEIDFIDEALRQTITYAEANRKMTFGIIDRLNGEETNDRNIILTLLPKRDEKKDQTKNPNTFLSNTEFVRYLVKNEVGSERFAGVFMYFIGEGQDKWGVLYKEWRQWRFWLKEQGILEEERKVGNAGNFTLLKGNWVYYFIKMNGDIYRTQLEFTKIENGHISAKYSGSNNQVLVGKAKVDDSDRLFIRLANYKKGLEMNVVYFRAKIDKYEIPKNDSEGVILGTRTINIGNSYYSSISILRRLPASYDLKEYPDTLIEELNETDSTQSNIVKFLASSGGFETPYKFDFEKDKEIDDILKKKGRSDYNVLKECFSNGEGWVSLSRITNSDSISVAQWDFDFDELKQKCVVTRIRKDKYIGEVTTCEKGYYWLALYKGDSRKFLFGRWSKSNGTQVLLMFGSFLYDPSKEDLSDCVTREILIPKRLLPKDIDLSKSEISYPDFETIDLSAEINLYLNSFENSRLSFPNSRTKNSFYEKQLNSLQYVGNYYLYERNRYSKDGDLFRFSLTIDSLAKVTLNKWYEDGTVQSYEGLAQAMNRTLVVSLDYAKSVSKSKQGNQKERQNAVIYFIIDLQRPAPDVLIGQMADTDREGLPDCSACFAIRQIHDKSEKKLFVPKLIKRKAQEYSEAESLLTKNYGEYLKKKFDLEKEVTSIDQFFNLVGGVYYQNHARV